MLRISPWPLTCQEHQKSTVARCTQEGDKTRRECVRIASLQGDKATFPQRLTRDLWDVGELLWNSANVPFCPPPASVKGGLTTGVLVRLYLPSCCLLAELLPRSRCQGSQDPGTCPPPGPAALTAAGRGEGTSGGKEKQAGNVDVRWEAELCRDEGGGRSKQKAKATGKQSALRVS